MGDARGLRRAKRELRERLRAARDRLPSEDREAFAGLILARLLALPSVREAQTLLLFASFGSEVPTAGMIERLGEEGRRVALPRVDTGELSVVTFRPGEAMARAPYGAMEPTRGEVLSPEALDVVIPPGLAFDPRGRRLGYGGGFYDRLLRRTRPDALRLAIAFDLQIVDLVPHGPGDEPVDGVVTERRTLWTQPPRAHPLT